MVRHGKRNGRLKSKGFRRSTHGLHGGQFALMVGAFGWRRFGGLASVTLTHTRTTPVGNGVTRRLIEQRSGGAG